MWYGDLHLHFVGRNMRVFQIGRTDTKVSEEGAPRENHSTWSDSIFSDGRYGFICADLVVPLKRGHSSRGSPHIHSGKHDQCTTLSCTMVTSNLTTHPNSGLYRCIPAIRLPEWEVGHEVLLYQVAQGQTARTWFRSDVVRRTLLTNWCSRFSSSCGDTTPCYSATWPMAIPSIFIVHQVSAFTDSESPATDIRFAASTTIVSMFESIWSSFCFPVKKRGFFVYLYGFGPPVSAMSVFA